MSACVRRIDGEPTRRGAFAVRSTSNPEHEWAVDWLSPKTHHCDCIKFSQDNRCRHVLAVFAAIAQEWQERRAAEAQACQQRRSTERIAS